MLYYIILYVVFEDVVFDDNSSVTPYNVTSSYRIR